MATAAQIRQGMIDRGLAPHVADAFVLNFQDESGLDPSITEAVPNVHGTRGRGLYQLTGSRRDAYEARHGDAYDVDSQLDWLMYELQGPEANAFSRINAAGNTGEAAAAIVSHFLRPAEEHRASRSARYLGGAAPQYSNAPQTGQNALAAGLPGQQGPSDQMNALAMLEQFRPRTNALDPRAFMTQQQAPQMIPIPRIQT